MRVERKETIRDFPPLKKGHPTLHLNCPGCLQQFRIGDVVTLVLIGPGDDPLAQERCRDGLSYAAVSIPAHWACATGARS